MAPYWRRGGDAIPPAGRPCTKQWSGSVVPITGPNRVWTVVTGVTAMGLPSAIRLSDAICRAGGSAADETLRVTNRSGHDRRGAATQIRQCRYCFFRHRDRYRQQRSVEVERQLSAWQHATRHRKPPSSMRLVMMPSHRRRMPTTSAAWQAAPAHQVQLRVGRPGPSSGRQPRHTSTPAAHGSNLGVPLAKQSPCRRTQSAAPHGAAAHARDAKDIRCELNRIGMPNVSRCACLLRNRNRCPETGSAFSTFATCAASPSNP